MAKVPLLVGAYQAKSVIASAQRCINLYMENNPQGVDFPFAAASAPFPFTLYPTPGLTLKGSVSDAGWRGLYYATNGKLYGVAGSSVYYIDSTFAFTKIGTILTTSGPVQMVDNGNYVILVDGSPQGYTIYLSDNTFAQINQAAFYGSPTINYVDGFYVLAYLGTAEWYISLANSTTFDGTDFASKSGFPDKMVGIGIAKRYIYLFGQQTTEVWFNAGDSLFTFERLPGSYIQYGCAASASIAQMDGQIFWLAQSPQGKATVCMTQNFNAVKISTYAIDAELATYSRVDDAIGYTYQQNGHYFYVLTFPTADKTWMFDYGNQQWSEWLWLDGNGQFHRHRGNCFSMAYGVPIVGDWQNGNLYMLDQDNYTDNGAPISRVRGFFHSEDNNSSRMRYREFIAEMEVGNGDGTSDVPVYLQYSDDRGKSFSNPIKQSLGLEGEYLTSIQWQRLGMARDRVFELFWSAPVKTALSGAFVQVESNNQ